MHWVMDTTISLCVSIKFVHIMRNHNDLLRHEVDTVNNEIVFFISFKSQSNGILCTE